MRRLWTALAFLLLASPALARENPGPDDAYRIRTAYAEDSDLIEQVIRFIFPITGRERRPTFEPFPYWGTKKPQYKEFDWHKFETDHFILYGYPETETVLPTVAQYLEEEHEKNNRIFGVKNRFTKKVPIIFYLSRRDFEQSSIIGGPVPESLGGLTELFAWKRVTFPFVGEDYELEHVVKHEGTHVYQIAKNAKKLPLWFIEGSAETNSVKWDAQAEITLRDAYLNGFFYNLEDLWQIEGTWLMYKEGNFITNLIWDEYGEEGFRKIFDRADSMSFEDNLKESLGLTPADLQRKVSEALAKKYGPILAQHDLLEGVTPLAKKRMLLRARGRFFLSGGTSGNREAIYLEYVAPDGKNRGRKVVDDRRYRSESLNSFRKGAWLDERRIAYAIRRSERDVIRVLTYSYNPKKRKFTLGKPKEISAPGIDTLSDPVLIGDSSVAFIGLEAGFSNLYRFDWVTGKLEKLTNDNRHYSGLDYSPARNELAFSREDGRTGILLRYDRNLYTMNLATGVLTQLTATPDSREESPRFAPDGRSLLFVSDRRETYDAYLYSFDTDRVRTITRMRVGARNPNFGEGETLYLNSYEKTVPSIYLVPMPKLREQLLADLPVRNFVPAAIEGTSVVLVNPPAKKPEETISPADGLRSVDGKGVVYLKEEPFEILSAAALEDGLLVETRRGLPGSKKVEEDDRRHFFSVTSRVDPLDSDRFARPGLSAELKNRVTAGLKGRALVEAWTDPDGSKALIVVNNRLAAKEKDFKSAPTYSMLLYDAPADTLKELKNAPVGDSYEKIQWVAFLKPKGILLASGGQSRGPFLLGVVDEAEGKFTVSAEIADLFRVSRDRDGFFWIREEGLHVANSEGALADKRPFSENLKGKPMAADYVPNGGVEVVTVRGENWRIEFFDPKTGKRELTPIPHVRKEKLRQAAVDPETGSVAFSVGRPEPAEAGEELRIWNSGSKSASVVPAEGIRFEAPVYRKGYLTFRSQGVRPALPKEWVYSGGRIAPFEKLKSLRPSGDGRLLLETDEHLTRFEPETGRSAPIAGPVAGYAASGGSVAFSSPVGGTFQVQLLDRGSVKPVEVFKSPQDQIDPEIGPAGVAWTERLPEGWAVQESAPRPGSDVKTYHLGDYDLAQPKYEGDRLTVRAYPTLRDHPQESAPFPRPAYPRLLDRMPSPTEIRVQSLLAAAAYDGDSVRLIVSGYAGNLFSDHGVLVNGVFLGDSQFASMSYADLEHGRTYSLFYNFQDELRNGGVDLSKDFILDRYREISVYGDFEFQHYGLPTAATVDYVTPDLTGRTFYLVKGGVVYAYDVTVWDNHGPVSGSRFFVKGEVGGDAGNGGLANVDAGIDYRFYTQIIGRFGFAHRIVAGTSQGDLPNVFLMGGNLSFRGVGFEDLRGQNYWVFSEDLRIPVFDFLGAKFFDPLDQILGIFTRYFDVRGGIYADVGQVWFNHRHAPVIYSVGYFVNVPTIFGLQFRFDQGFAGEKGFDFWAGVNW